IAIFDLPDSFRHPGRWHVRTYGLFAANPFGQREFPRGDQRQGAVTVAAGESLRLHYRVLLYAGEKSAEELSAIAEQYGAGSP
ncbi:MAG TPA: PmoA family protein, partial [Lacipirellulaceae bacterium]|nr:PmoA family protein [Lacipirellulaceae bacterium]